MYNSAAGNLDTSVALGTGSVSPYGGSTVKAYSNNAMSPGGKEEQVFTSQAADLQSVTSSVTVNDLRFSFQLQKQLERMARGGTRYIEYVQAAFGVTSPDSRLQRSEYLGGSRNPLSVQQVAQTAASTEDSPLAQLGAYSLSAGRARCIKSFTEHGWLMCLAVVRYYHVPART